MRAVERLVRVGPGRWRRIALLVLLALLLSGCNPGAYPLDIFMEMHYEPSQRRLEPRRLAPPADAVPVTRGRTRQGAAERLFLPGSAGRPGGLCQPARPRPERRAALLDRAERARQHAAVPRPAQRQRHLDARPLHPRRAGGGMTTLVEIVLPLGALSLALFTLGSFVVLQQATPPRLYTWLGFLTASFLALLAVGAYALLFLPS